jgi:hypothetical protein
VTTGHPQYGLMCEICYAALTPDRCAVDANGDAWDVCAGDCARQSGIVERRVARPTLMDRIGLHFDFYWPVYLVLLAVMGAYLLATSAWALVTAS